jgi:hypothetical protein
MTIIVQSIDVSFGCVKLSSAYLSTVLFTCQDFFQTLSRDSPAFGPTKLPVGTKVVPIVHTTGNVRGLAGE